MRATQSSILKHEREENSYAVTSLAFSPASDILAAGRESRSIELWDPAGAILLGTLTCDVIDLESMVFSPDGKRLYAKDLVFGVGLSTEEPT